MPPPPGVLHGRETDVYLSEAALCRSLTHRTSSLIRYTSLPQSEVTREAILANRAQMPGRITVATQRNSPNLHWRILVSSGDSESFRPAHDVGDVGRSSRFFVKSSWVDIAEKSLSWASSVLACTGDLTWTFSFLNRLSEKRRAHNNKSGLSHTRTSSICVAIAPTAPPDLRKYTIGADQTTIPQTEGPRWTAIPRSSPDIFAGPDGMQLGRH